MIADYHPSVRLREHLLGVAVVAALALAACSQAEPTGTADAPSLQTEPSERAVVDASTREYDIRHLLRPREGSLAHILEPDRPRVAEPQRRAFEGSAVHATDAEAIEQLVAIVLENISSLSAAQVTATDGRLAVAAAEPIQEQVQDLLDELHVDDPRVMLEMRYLLLDERTLGSLRQGVLDAARPVEMSGPADASTAREAYIVNDRQVDQIIGASQASDASAGVSAPRMTLFNGQDGQLQMMTEHAYIRDYEMADGEAEPVVDVFELGIFVHSGGRVTDDRRYVDFAFRTRLTTATGPVERREHPAGTPDEPLFTEHPAIDQVELLGRATVPDVGTLLVIGDVVEGTLELDSAIADDDPRFSQERHVVLLVRPSILIQQQPGPGFPRLRE